ncbi:cupin domain-containing protein [Leptotrichia sp. oral taxon 847]|uniref:cupin domain-containing protein n=1 Tax=Leptotrichia sp. oral taxon 847 TaxID=1785996 RepID=UPI0007683B58|nr:cupin domain-containing protein [Leptotrichia sp. oral taxon 847]AMD94272.1 hypothetical protein AXF11_00795 [Leptotrichia sp. oral taxon 847]
MNIFDFEKLENNEEIITILEENKNIKIEKIISTGQTTDWQSSDKNEFVILIQGEAEITYLKNSEIVKLSSGDTILIEKNKKHKVSYTSKNPHCVWICIFYK